MAARLKILRATPHFTLDLISAALITFSILFTAYLITFADVDLLLAMKSVFMFTLTVGGLILHQAFCGGIQIDTIMSLKERMDILSVSAVGFITVLVGQFVVFRTTAGLAGLAAVLTAMELKLFYVSVAIAEETFFRFYLQTMIFQQTRMMFVSIFISSLMFMGFHWFVYSFSPIFVLVTLVSSLVLGVVYHFTGRASVNMMIHVAVNILAS